VADAGSDALLQNRGLSLGPEEPELRGLELATVV
jgi:hypothetical protein